MFSKSLFAAACMLAPMAFSQNLSTTRDLKLACESSAGNRVTISSPANIEFGAPVTNSEIVNSPCTIIFSGTGGLSTRQIGLRFNGALRLQSNQGVEIKMIESAIFASSIAFDLAGPGNVVGTSDTNFRATAGGFSMNFGANSRAELIEALSTNQNAIEASGSIAIQAGSDFGAVFKEASMQAGTGITIAANGANAVIKLDETSLRTASGSVSVTSPGTKGVLEINKGNYRAPGSIDIAFRGGESGIGIKDANFESTGGGITVESAAGTGSIGKMEVSQSVFNAPGALRLTSAPGGQLGSVGVDNVTLNGRASVQVLSGAGGNTLVKNSRSTTLGTLELLTGVGGVCLAESNAINAPAPRVCR
jgi:hypothetical protein